MTTDKTRTLWGNDFRLVVQGLAETDVVIFVEKLMRQHRESLKQLDHISALHGLATKTVEDAQKLAESITAEARRSSEEESARTISEAGANARQILAEAERAAKEQSQAELARLAAIGEEYRKRIRTRVARVDSALLALKEAAVRELCTRMASHYVGKYLAQSVHFIPAFEKLVREVEADLAREDEGIPPAPEIEPPQQESAPEDS